MKKNHFTAILALICAICCTLSLVACGSNGAGGGNGNGGGRNEPEFASGSGTQDSPYVIDRDYQWLNVAKYPNAYFELSADINLGDYKSVSPIGTAETPFTGTIDGKNHAIAGVAIKSKHTPGLFGVLSGATVKNLRFENSSVAMTSDYDDGEYMGSFAAVARKGTEIENCHTENINMTFQSQTSYFNFVGGFVGSLESVSSAVYCSCDVKISCSSGTYPGFYIGGFAVLAAGSTIDCCAVTGSVTMKGYTKAYVMDIATIVYTVKNSTISNMCIEMNINAMNSDVYTLAGKVDEETLKYCLNFSTYKYATEGRYKKCDVSSNASRDWNICFTASNLGEANSTLDSSLWSDNKYWKKGKLHPELVSYEEYLELKKSEEATE